ncbi:hypothetical protein [Hydrogenimonas urashimensis]|uniref:hypothetical protein n=1 Tax=Hydrogenimonas urashimensis TaxID=2740515 RepID=UPI0019151F92|nr:hypothetical protein [Hydrogenimonas urashimensis]
MKKGAILAQTLGEQLDEVQAAITASLKGHRMEIGDKSIEHVSLSKLQEREAYLIDKIAKYGRDHIPGSSTGPLPRKARIVFS